MHYCAMAHVDIVTDVDKPELSLPLKLADQQKWMDATQDKFHTIDKNETSVGTRHNNRLSSPKVLPSGIVLEIKRRTNGDVAKYRARLFVRGNFHSDVVDYAELYAPVAFIELLRLMPSISFFNIYSIDQLDVKAVLSHDTLPKSDKV